MVKLIHKERIAEGSTRRFLDGRRNDVPLRKGIVAKFRESHHVVAKLFAAGLKGQDVAARTGYAPNWIAQLHNDPSFQELLAKYRDLDTQLFLEGRDEFYSLATKNMIQAERQLSDKMDEADEESETLPTRELISIVADRADRFGYGKRETKFNVNVDFADALQRAIKRSGKTIDGTVTEGMGGMKLLARDEGPSPVPQSGSVSSLALGDQSQVDGVEGGYFGSNPSPVVSGKPDRAPHSLVPQLGSTSSSARDLSPGRAVETQSEGMVPPKGQTVSQPLRRRLLSV